jgi:hypothetical protein
LAKEWSDVKEKGLTVEVCFIRECAGAVAEYEVTIAVEGKVTHPGIAYFPKTLHGFRKTHKF